MTTILTKKITTFALFLGLGIPVSIFAQFGKDGSRTITTANTIVNTYTNVALNVNSGDNSIVAGNINLLAGSTVNTANGGNPFTTDALSAGDLIMLYQAQGASIDVGNTITYGEVTNYNSAGVYEFARVLSINSNTIILDCPIRNDYTTNGKAQIIRVPQYNDVTINVGASLAASAWDGFAGGVLSIHAENTIDLGNTGSLAIDVTGLGFRGGVVENSTSQAGAGLEADFVTGSANSSAEKGESIAGFQNEYDVLGGRYGRGAVANGGGGGNGHNAGGGGGANGGVVADWTGMGVMCTTCLGNAAWTLDQAYTANGNTLTTSAGGGRGGYTYSSSNQDALTLPPEHVSWGGDRRDNVGGLGGRPLDQAPESRFFFGGGGGAGDGNNNSNESGANGGGAVYLIANQIIGTAIINANGADGLDTRNTHNDAPGGGGGGGTVIIRADIASTITINANGGEGGSQLITSTEGEGPGGGGGGGIIAVTTQTSTPTFNINGGNAGITTSASLTEFPSNGGTDGNAGNLLTVTGDWLVCLPNIDDDNDGIPDWVEAYNGDHDNDGTPDFEDPDFCADNFSGINGWDCNNGLPDPSGDLDGDGIPNYADTDFPTCTGLVNGVCSVFDFDGDGLPNHLDVDSDNDGIGDLVEAGGVDTDGDGTLDDLTDTDGDGLADIVDNDDTDGPDGTNPCIPEWSCLNQTSTSSFIDTNNDGLADNLLDTDGDGMLDYLDLDSDNDGIPDLVEAGGTDTDGDGQVDNIVDNNGDGLHDPYSGATICTSTMTNDVTLDFWAGISGTTISQLTSNANYPNNPTSSSTLTTLDAPNNIDNNYGQRIYGYIVPLETGAYTFNITGDDQCRFSLSTDDSPANLVQTAYHTGWTNDMEHTKYATQTSTVINLVAGESYYFEILHKEGGGGDQVQIYWRTPSVPNTWVIVPSSVLTRNAPDCSSSIPLVTTSADLNNDGIGDGYANGDFDGDGIPNHLDLDADNDGIQDILEAGGVDADNDGIVDNLNDSDRDGLADLVDGDVGNDGVAENTANALTITGDDNDNDGRPDTYPNDNVDGQGLPNFLDLDSDDDGITDIVENNNGNVTGSALSDSPSNGDIDGQVGDGAITDGNTNGWNDGNEGNTSLADFDGDGIPNYLDIDADNDGIPDYLEGVCTGCIGATGGFPTGGDADGDGILDVYDGLSTDNTTTGANSGVHPNEDNDDGSAPFDFLDTDTDNDSHFDWAEGFDTNGDGYAIDDILAFAAAYEAANGNPGHYPQPSVAGQDPDGDGIPNWADNQPNTPDYIENVYPPFLTSGNASFIDADGDGLVDIFDPNMGGTLAPTPNTDNVDDDDWRDTNNQVELPIELLFFDAEKEENHVLLNWATATELNNDYFVVERSKDALEFEAIGEVAGAGTTTMEQYYQMIDHQPMIGINYYRLRQVDFDGTTSYSEIRAVEFEQNIGLNYAPNPTSGLVTLYTDAELDESTTIIITDMLGRQLIQMEVASGTLNRTTIDLTTLVAGTYHVQLISNTQLISGFKVVKE